MPAIDFKHVVILIAYAVITAVLNLIFSKRSQIDEWCEANPKLAAFAKLLRGVGIDPWTIFQSVVLAFTKKLPDYQKQSLVELKSKSQDPPPTIGGVLVLLLAIGFALHSSACAAADPHVCNPVDAVTLTSAYAANVHLQCQGYTFDACPVRPALEADLNKQLASACPTGAK